MKKFTFLCLIAFPLSAISQAVTIDASPAGRRQVMDGFGTCLAGEEGKRPWFQNLYYDDAWCSILRVDLVPRNIEQTEN